MPLLAVLVLHASTFVVTVLTATAYLPWLLIGLPVGAWVDRLRCRPLMIACDLVAAVLYGCGYGCYLAVDQALITQVLPQAADRAKDLGIINIAIIGPSALGGGLAAALVSLGGYPLLFAATAVAAAGGAAFVWKVKSVR